MIRRPPRSTLSSSSAASDVYKRQSLYHMTAHAAIRLQGQLQVYLHALGDARERGQPPGFGGQVGTEGLRRDIERGQADSADSDAVPLLQLFRGGRGVDGDTVIAAAFDDAGNRSDFFN